MSREEYLQRGDDLERQEDEEFAQSVRKAKEAGYGNCVIFRDDGGYNRQYLTVNGGWTVDRTQAAKCLDTDEADQLAEKYNVVFFGRGPNDPGCDILVFRYPEAYQKWLAANGNADDPHPTERFMVADLKSATPYLTAKDLLRRG